MSKFHIILAIVNFLIVAGLLFLCTRKTEDAMSNAMAGVIFWACMIVLAVIDGLALLIHHMVAR